MPKHTQHIHEGLDGFGSDGFIVGLDGCVKQVEARKVRSNGSPSLKPQLKAREKDVGRGLPLGLASSIGLLVAWL